MATDESLRKIRPLRVCATMDEHRRLAQLSAEYRRTRREIEYETQRFLARVAGEGLKTGVVRIPVVVHVVWNTAAQNVSAAQIQSQIDVLNADFRRTNADAGSVPAAFAPFAADTRIEFALAVRDPNCGATNGITRTNTSTVGFTMATRNNVKSAGTGGANPWPSNRYLNLWVANFTDSLLGFGTFPGGPANLDGIVIRTSAFGTLGTVTAPFHLGRTATHEVGHWLNLLHIWADDTSSANQCLQDDMCADTPVQADENYGTPGFPQISCSNGPNGDMFMNYMDYVDDAAMFMFTADQAARMQATLSVARNSLLASDGLVPPNAPATPDLWMQDAGDDTGIEPYAGSGLIYLSDDIWCRVAADGFTVQDHQNPNGEQPNNVYVRVRNRGCPAAGTQSGTLKLYWAKASPSLSWPAPWDGSVTSPALMGGPIGSQGVAVAGGAQQILAFPWTPPDPSDYMSFGADRAHFCLLARIETASTAPFGMTFPETGNLADNVIKNNNIAWKNIAIVDTDGDFAKHADVVLAQFDRERRVARYSFEAPAGRGPNLFEWGFVIVEARGKALAPWLGRELRGEGFQRLEDGRLMLTRPGAWIAAPDMKPGQAGTLNLQFVPHGRAAVGARVFELDLTERDGNGKLLGGQRFLLKTGRPPAPRCNTGVAVFDGVDWLSPDPGCGCAPI